MRDNSRVDLGLPLLGSNQDSSDPESQRTQGAIGGNGSENASEPPEPRPKSPGITHSFTPALEPLEAFGRVERIAVELGHKPDCKRILATYGAAAIECDHGYDCCPLCDPCECFADADSQADGVAA